MLPWVCSVSDASTRVQQSVGISASLAFLDSGSNQHGEFPELMLFGKTIAVAFKKFGLVLTNPLNSLSK